MPHHSPRVHREVVSYVRRSSRMNPSQQRAWAAHAGRLVVDVPRGSLSTSVRPGASVDWPAVFGHRAPIYVEIGSGTGEALVALAERHPDTDIVAFEVFTPAVASTLSRIVRHDLTNVRLVMADGAEGLEHLFGPASIDQVCTFFPDPWHKARHHKRRLVGPRFAALVASRLVPGGLWRLATDWEDYARAMREALDAAPGLSNVHGGWAPRFEERPLTRYEARGLAAGRPVFDLTYRRDDVPVVGDLLLRTPLPGATGEVPL